MRRGGTGAPMGRIRPAPSQKPGSRAGRWLCSGQAGSQRLALSPTPGLSGGWLLSFPSTRPRQGASMAPVVGLRWGQAGPNQPSLPGPGWEAEEWGCTAGEGPPERHCWGRGLRQGASERSQRPPPQKPADGGWPNDGKTSSRPAAAPSLFIPLRLAAGSL